jgi:hypothetical protein
MEKLKRGFQKEYRSGKLKASWRMGIISSSLQCCGARAPRRLKLLELELTSARGQHHYFKMKRHYTLSLMSCSQSDNFKKQ